MRHGKSSWEYDMDDFDRPLNARGTDNAIAMGRFLYEKIGTPQAILTSTAKRALDTASLAAEQLVFPKEKINMDEQLYLASSHTILERLAATSDEVESCLLVGHNPGLTMLINHFGVWLDNLPTASVACFVSEVSSWRDISPANIRFQWLQLARKL